MAWAADPEADILFDEVIRNSTGVNPVMLKKAYMYFIMKHLNVTGDYGECESLCDKALEIYPGDIDLGYFSASTLNKKGDHGKAWELLKDLEVTLREVGNNSEAIFVPADPGLLYGQLLSAAQGLGDVESVIHYAGIVLASDKNKQSILSPYIYTLKKHGSSEEEIVDLLSKVYDFSDPNDLMFIARAAKDCGEADFARLIMAFAQEVLGMDKLEQPVQTVEEPAGSSAGGSFGHKEIEELIAIREQEAVEPGFDAMMRKAAAISEKELFERIRKRFKSLSDEDKAGIERYYTKFHFWGALDIKNGVYEALRARARVLRRHHKDIIWLYKRLSDARSKNVLHAIISNWLNFDFYLLVKYQENELPEYFHPDIFPPREGEVYVDAGAYNGDSTVQFIYAHGLTYKNIYCYEIAPDAIKAMEGYLAGVPNVEIRKKAVGATPGTMYIDFGSDDTAGRVVEQGDATVEVVCMDDDIAEPVTFIKMDVEGAEQDALRGCARQIRENRPRLAICTYHGYDDLYMIPRLIDEIQPGYKFYMRHHGGNRVPTEYSLLAVWDER
jgi:FkbM family methyltransferase